MTRNNEEELAHMKEVNLTLRRQLERARKDVLLYAAQFCEDHYVNLVQDGEAYVMMHHRKDSPYNHVGHAYADKLREIAG